MTDMISVRGLVFDYPGTRALDSVEFSLEGQTITALVGPNGAGKTTLLRCIAGLDTPYAGDIEVAGLDVLSRPRESHRCLGFLADSFGLYDELSVRQCLLYRAAALGMPAPKRAPAVEIAAQRLAIAQSIVHHPPVLLLDEPASGLDPEARVGLAETLLRLKGEGMTIIVSSHILSELEDYSTHMLVLRGGRLVESRALATPGEGRASRVTLRLAHGDGRLEALLRAEAAVSELMVEGLTAEFHFAGSGEERALLLRRLIGAELPIADFAAERESLQELYMSGVAVPERTP